MGIQRITQDKKFVPYSRHRNSASDGTSFMLESLGDFAKDTNDSRLNNV